MPCLRPLFSSRRAGSLFNSLQMRRRLWAATAVLSRASFLLIAWPVRKFLSGHRFEELRRRRNHGWPSLAIRANPEEFKPMRHRLEAVFWPRYTFPVRLKTIPGFRLRARSVCKPGDDGGQIAPTLGHGGQNLPIRERMRMLPQDLQNRLAWTGDLSRVPAEEIGQPGQGLRPLQVGVKPGFHFDMEHQRSSKSSPAGKPLGQRRCFSGWPR